MFDDIHAHLLRRIDSRRPKEHWRRVFEYRWRRPGDHVGYMISDRDEPVGYLGVIFSEATIDGRPERFCNVTSWIARETHRAEASMLAMSLRGLREYTITNLSCSEGVFRIFSRLGFEVLDSELMILCPTVALIGPNPGGRCRIDTEPFAIAPALEQADARILEDHLPYARHLLARTGDGYCYIVYTIGRRGRLRSARLHYISDEAIFRRYWPTIQRRLLLQHGSVLAECDSRLLGGPPPPGGFRMRIQVPRLFKSPSLRPDQVPNLYTELILLSLV